MASKSGKRGADSGGKGGDKGGGKPQGGASRSDADFKEAGKAKGGREGYRPERPEQTATLDPRLAMFADPRRVEGVEGLKQLRKRKADRPAEKGGAFRLGGAVRVGGAFRSAAGVSVPETVSRLPLATQSLTRQVSESEARRIEEQDLVTVLVDARQRGALKGALARHDGELLGEVGTIVIARVPRRKLLALSAEKSVRFIESNYRLRPALEPAHVSAKLTTRQGRRTVPQTGRGVLVGVVDTGIDVRHPAFRGRIESYSDQESGNANVLPDGSPDVIGHGTHVAGIAAGAKSRQYPYEGVAPGATLAVVKTTFDTADIALAVADIFDRAKDRPCVINLSLGGHYGGHDGSSVLERAIDELCDERPGRVVVVSAGNEGNARIHASTVLPARQTGARWVADFEINPTVNNGSVIGLIWLQVWTHWEDDVRVTLRAPNGEQFTVPLTNGRATEIDRGTFAINASNEIAPYSRDRVHTFGIFTVADPKWLRGWSVIAADDPARAQVEVGSVHAWILGETMGQFTGGATRSHLVGMPGTSFSAVTVGSYATRERWRSRTRGEQVMDAVKLEDISYFSSPGPTREGQNKPEVAAPGQWIVSARSRNASDAEMPDWTWVSDTAAAMQGTSMSAPYVTGAVALLLERQPKLSWAEVKRRLIKSVRQDYFSQPCWNQRWGYGKIDVQRLLSVEPAG